MPLKSSLCMIILTLGVDQSCNAENDTIWGIEWQLTSAGTTAIQKCPGLSESAGKYYKIFQIFVDRFNTLTNLGPKGMRVYISGRIQVHVLQLLCNTSMASLCLYTHLLHLIMVFK